MPPARKMYALRSAGFQACCVAGFQTRVSFAIQKLPGGGGRIRPAKDTGMIFTFLLAAVKHAAC